MRSQIQVLASGKPNNKLESRERICSKEDMEPEKVKEQIDKGEKRWDSLKTVWVKNYRQTIFKAFFTN